MYPSKRTMSELVGEALLVQDAVNLRALAPHFAQAVVDLKERLVEANQPSGTEDVNAHPIVTLWLDKMCQLNGMATSPFKPLDAAWVWVEANYPELLKKS